jgi:hypothetical protein
MISRPTPATDRIRARIRAAVLAERPVREITDPDEQARIVAEVEAAALRRRVPRPPPHRDPTWRPRHE